LFGQLVYAVQTFQNVNSLTAFVLQTFIFNPTFLDLKFVLILHSYGCMTFNIYYCYTCSFSDWACSRTLSTL